MALEAKGSSPFTHPIHSITVGVSPSGKASDFDSDIRVFKSRYPCQHDSLAQSVEHLTFNQRVRGSSPRWITKYALVAELVDALDLGSSLSRYEFESLRAHHSAKYAKCLTNTSLCVTIHWMQVSPALRIVSIVRAPNGAIQIRQYAREWLSGRALPCQGKCRGSESRLPLQYAPLAQLVEQLTLNQWVPGSNP